MILWSCQYFDSSAEITSFPDISITNAENSYDKIKDAINQQIWTTDSLKVVVIYYLKLSLEALMPSGLVTLVLVNCFHLIGSAFEITAFNKVWH